MLHHVEEHDSVYSVSTLEVSATTTGAVVPSERESTELGTRAPGIANREPDVPLLCYPGVLAFSISSLHFA